MREWSARLARLEATIAARVNPPKRHRVFFALDPLLNDPAWRVAHGLSAVSPFPVHESFEAAQASDGGGPVVTYYGPTRQPTEPEEIAP